MHTRKPVTVPEFEAIMLASPPRWRAYWRVLWATGLRVSELVMLRERDVDLTAVTLDVARRPGWAPKYGSTGVLPLSPDAIEALRPMLAGDPASRERRPFNPAGASVATRTRSIDAALARIVARAGLRADLTPHCFRHAFAHRARDAGVHVSVLQRMLRHRSLASTGAYLTADLPAMRLAVEAMA